MAGYLKCYYSCETNSNSGTISAEQCDNVGGIAGRMTFGGALTIMDFSNDGEVTGKTHVGGIAGVMDSVRPSYGTFVAAISDCENSGAITASGNYAGGIVGQATGYKDVSYVVNLEISNNTNKGTVTAGGYYAAIVGQAGSNVNLNSSLWASNTNSGQVANNKIYN